MGAKKELISYLQSISLLLLGILLIAFPLVLFTKTTDVVFLPKQVLLGASVLLLLVIFGAKTIIEGNLRFRRTVFDLPVIILTTSIFLSSLFSINRADSLIAFVSLLFGALAFFVITNIVRDKNSLLFLISALVLGATALAIVSILSFLKIYLLPFDFTKAQTFTPLGSFLDQAMYLALVLPLALYFGIKIISSQKVTNSKTISFGIASIIIAIALPITIYGLFAPPPVGQKSFILPFETGFQTGFAAISQDSGRVLQGFLLGSGFGTYIVDFSRFKQAAFNQNSSLWSLTFLRSSSFILELLATAGILSILSFAFLILRIIKEKPIFPALLLTILLSFALPFSFVIQTLLFILLGLFAVIQGLKGNENRFFDVEIQLVALKKGLIVLENAQDRKETNSAKQNLFLPIVFSAVILIVVLALGFFSVRFLISDITFQESLVAASQNNGTVTYQKQGEAINLFPYKDSYYRAFSQTNLALANSLAASQPKDSSPSAQTQQTISTFIQQSINAGRTATRVSPLTSANWQNLSSIYRGLIGFGQNAENFAIATAQQAAFLDPNNPQQYISLGGIYFQLGQYDNAQNQFQIAVNLKPDYANAYYNLGHALENKGDLQNALLQYQAVKNLVGNDENSLKQITSEIEALQKKLENKDSGLSETGGKQAETPLNVNVPQTQLPPQAPKVKIPPPNVSTESGK